MPLAQAAHATPPPADTVPRAQGRQDAVPEGLDWPGGQLRLQALAPAGEKVDEGQGVQGPELPTAPMKKPGAHAVAFEAPETATKAPAGLCAQPVLPVTAA